jgi:hypothetical protein
MSGDNLNSFIGLLWSNTDDILGVVWHHAIRSSIKDVIFNEDLALPDDFRASFLQDIVAVSSDRRRRLVRSESFIIQGVDQLHNTFHIPHGRLNVRTCLVTPYWSIRLSEFGMNSVLEDLCARECITIDSPNPLGTIHLGEL